MLEVSFTLKDNYMLNCKAAKKLYNTVQKLPIVDYHCHLSPKEIYEDKPFSNIGEIWLGSDHYKWRLMRTAGVDEEYITGGTTFKEKFIKSQVALVVKNSPANAGDIKRRRWNP